MAMKVKHFGHVHERFTAPVSQRYDCGRMCAPLNGGEPVCCTTDNAVPVVERAEYKYLKKRTDLWRGFKPTDAASRQIVDELAPSCLAIECKGAAHCEREHRTVACRSFPFFPYFTKEKEIIGLSYYWTFEDRCWVISNLQIVEQEFVDQLIEAYVYIFEHDEDEEEAYIDQSASMRRVFSRSGRVIPIIGRDGKIYKILPKSGGKIIDANIEEFAALEPFTSDEAYREAIEEADGDPAGKTLSPDWSIKDWWNND